MLGGELISLTLPFPSPPHNLKASLGKGGSLEAQNIYENIGDTMLIKPSLFNIKLLTKKKIEVFRDREQVISRA